MAGQVWDTRWVPSVERYRGPKWHCRIVRVHEGSFHTMRRVWQAEEAKRGNDNGNDHDPDRA